MQKNWKRSTSTFQPQPKPSRRYPVPMPEVVNMDVLSSSALSDSDLISKLHALIEDRDKVFEANLETKPWEVEIAYVRRELTIRRTRRETHEQYLRMLQKEHDIEEAHLPVAGLDNSRFLKIIGEWN